LVQKSQSYHHFTKNNNEKNPKLNLVYFLVG
jgi:hypothetical protein